MASLRQIRRRLRSVQSTKQIMRAMQLVAGSKLKRTQSRLAQAQTVLGFLTDLAQRVLASSQLPSHPLTTGRDEQGSLLVVFTSDTGLCGSYNTNLIQLAETHLIRDTATRTHLIFIGKKGYRALTRRGYEASGAYLDLAGRPDIIKAEQIGRQIMERFTSGQVGSVQMLYAKPVSASSSRPVIAPWLPISLAPRPSPLAPLEYIFEPSPQRIMDELLPRWALANFVVTMLEAFVSEHSARMMAMKNATDNAEELLGELTRQRNKVRQATITKELSEIVGTVEALK